MSNPKRPALPCVKHPDSRGILTIGIYPEPDETWEEAYCKWARRQGRNPWCSHPLESCPEPDEEADK